MVRHHHRTFARAPSVHLATQLADRSIRVEQRLCGDAPYAENDTGVHEFDLPRQIRRTALAFLRLWIAISRWAAFEDVGDEYFLAGVADGLQHGIEQLPRPADERLALPIFICAGRFTDDHPLRSTVADTENSVGARPMQTAQRACAYGLLERLPRHALSA